MSILLAFALSFPECACLGSDDFWTRQRAEAALQRRGVLALPALLCASRHPDLEVRRRGARLTAPWREWATQTYATGVALWLIYTPGQDLLPHKHWALRHSVGALLRIADAALALTGQNADPLECACEMCFVNYISEMRYRARNP